MVKTITNAWVAGALVVMALGGHSAMAQVMANPAAEKASAPDAPPVPESPPKPPKVVMVTVNGEEVTAQDYVNFLQQNPTFVGPSKTDAGKAGAMRVLVANMLVRQQMTHDGLVAGGRDITPAEWNEAYPKFVASHFPLPPAPDEAAVKRYYQQHKNDFGIPPLVRISQIQFRVVKQPSPEQRAQVREKAEAALRRLEAGEPFAALATELTENPDGKSRAGDLGFVPREGSPWLEAAIKDLKVGEHSKVIDSPAGSEIIFLTDERPRLNSSFDQVKEKIAQQLRAEAQAGTREAYVRELAKKAKIDIVQKDLQPLFANGVFP